MTSDPIEAAATSGIQTLAGYHWISFTSVTTTGERIHRWNMNIRTDTTRHLQSGSEGRWLPHLLERCHCVSCVCLCIETNNYFHNIFFCLLVSLPLVSQGLLLVLSVSQGLLYMGCSCYQFLKDSCSCYQFLKDSCSCYQFLKDSCSCYQFLKDSCSCYQFLKDSYPGVTNITSFSRILFPGLPV
jgi:hypothetical protein